MSGRCRRGGRRFREPELCRGCRGPLQSWQSLCDGCWRLLPWDKRGPIAQARSARAPHLLADAVMAAVEWLREHAPAKLAARVTGERE